MMSASKMRPKINKRWNLDRMISVATPDTQLFAISTNKTTENKLINLQKQEIYKTEDSECPSTHPIE